MTQLFRKETDLSNSADRVTRGIAPAASLRLLSPRLFEIGRTASGRCGPPREWGCLARSGQKGVEARAGIEPAHKGFADLSLTTWVPRLIQERREESSTRRADRSTPQAASQEDVLETAPVSTAAGRCGMERETRFELATLALARR